MLIVHEADRLEQLADALVETLGRGAPDDPLCPERVVVAGRGMQEWVTWRIAERLGVCMNVEFLWPGNLLRRVGLAAPGDPWSPDRLVWPLLEVLRARELEAATGARVADALDRWVGPLAGAPVDARAWGVAREVADRLDHYVVQRPALVRAWSGGAVGAEDDDESWQADVWRRLRARLAPARDAASRVSEAIATGGLSLDGRIHLFGVSALAPLYLEVVRGLARTMEVHWFVPQPTPHWLGDHDRRRPDERAAAEDLNPIVYGWARAAIRTQAVIESLTAGSADLQSRVVPCGAEAVPSAPGTLLGHLQEDIRSLRAPTRFTPAAGDRSVIVSSVPNPRRQVEIVRDEIVRRMSETGGAQPRDFLVLCPDIAAFEPHIVAVFSNAHRELDGLDRRLPFRITDRSIRASNPAADALVHLLGLVGGRTTRSEVEALLSNPWVRARFGIDEGDLPEVSRLLSEVDVHWGIGASERSARGLADDARYTWEDASLRIALGWAVGSGSDVRPWCGALGVALPGDERGSVRGRVMAYLTTLLSRLRSAETPRTPREWAAWLFVGDDGEGALASLLRAPPSMSWRMAEVADAVAELREGGDGSAESDRGDAPVEADDALRIRPDALRAWFEGRFRSPSMLPDDGPGALTFCSLVPARAIPYRHVYLLGMDEGAYPRARSRLPWDLLSTARHRGEAERDPGEEERYLFFEALTSARESLHVMWRGSDLRTGRPAPASPAVTGLLDVLHATLGVPPDQALPSSVFRVEAMHDWTPVAFRDGRGALRSAAARAATRLSRGVEASAEVDWIDTPRSGAVVRYDAASLARDLRDPAKAWLHAHGVHLPWEDESPDDRLPVGVGQDYQTKRRVVELVREALRAPVELRRERVEASMPRGIGAGRRAAASELYRTVEAVERLQDAEGAVEEVRWEVPLPHGVVTGRSRLHGGRTLVRLVHSDGTGEKLEDWVELLGLRVSGACADAEVLRVDVVAEGGPAATRHRVDPAWTVDQAREVLATLVRLGAASREGHVAAFRKSGTTLVEAIAKAEEKTSPWTFERVSAILGDPAGVRALYEDNLEAVPDGWWKDNPRGDGMSPSVGLLFPDVCPVVDAAGEVVDAFLTASLSVWLPLRVGLVASGTATDTDDAPVAAKTGAKARGKGAS